MSLITRSRFGVQLSRLDRWLIRFAVATSTTAAVATLLVASSQPKDYEPGDRFATISGSNWSKSPATIVIFLNTNCGASLRSSETFSRIARRPRLFRVVVIGYEGEDLLRPFVQVLAIEPDSILTAPVGSIRFSQVPRVALLDQRGVVRSVWSGKSINGMENKILSAAQSLASPHFP